MSATFSVPAHVSSLRAFAYCNLHGALRELDRRLLFQRGSGAQGMGACGAETRRSQARGRVGRLCTHLIAIVPPPPPRRLVGFGGIAAASTSRISRGEGAVSHLLRMSTTRSAARPRSLHCRNACEPRVICACVLARRPAMGTTRDPPRELQSEGKANPPGFSVHIPAENGRSLHASARSAVRATGRHA